MKTKMPKTVVKGFEKDGITYPIITLNTENTSKLGFTFGLSKARLILSCIDEIRAFVETCDKREESK